MENTSLYSEEIIIYLIWKIMKFARFPAIEFHYSGRAARLLNVGQISATAQWIGFLILQILTTLTSAYSTFNTLVDRLYINKIKVSLVGISQLSVFIFRPPVELQQSLI